MYENDGITVRQTVSHTIQLWPIGLGSPCGSRLSRRKAEKGTIIRSVSKPSCRNSGAGPYDTKTMGHGEEYIILVGG